MMKKIFICFMLVIMLSSTVFAMNNYIPKKSGGGDWHPKGLENAIMNVQNNGNEQALGKLQINWERFQEKHQERINYCNENCSFELEIDDKNQTRVRTQEKVQFKLLGFSGEANEEINFNEEGEIVESKSNFWRNMKKWGLAR